MTSSAEDWTARWQAALEHALDEAVADVPGSVPPLRAAMRYSLLAGGKRLRPLIVLAAARASGGIEDDALAPALAVEMIHTYSLIHDDLPAMDDDDLRRGKPTNHVVHGEAMAILAGDALQTLAFATLAEAVSDPARARDIVRVLARAAGAEGMCGGQVLDLLQEGRPADEPSVARIHALKTGALLAASFRIGALATGADAAVTDVLERAGRATGLAFQIQDDILDETASSAELGKTAGKDQRAHKATWPAVVGLEESKRRVAELAREALQAIEPLGRNADPLAQLVRRSVERRH